MGTGLLRYLSLAGIAIAGLALVSNLEAAGACSFKSGPIQITADGQWVWTANQDNDSVSRLDTRNDSVTEFPLPAGTRHGPRGLSIKEDGSEVWVACLDSDRVYVLEPTNGTVLAQIDLPWGSAPYSVALSRNQRIALVTLHRVEGLAAIDVATRQVTQTLQPVYRSPFGIVWTEDGQSAWVTHLFAEGEHPMISRVDVSGPEPRLRNSNVVFPSDPRQSSRLTAPNNVAEGGYLSTRGHPAQIPSVSGRRELWLPTMYQNISEDTYTPDSSIQSVIRRLDLTARTIPNGTNDKVILTALYVHSTASPNAFLGPGWNAGVAGPIDIAFNSNGSMVYLLHENSDDLVVMPTSTPLVKPTNAPPLTEIPVGNRPLGIAVSPTNDLAYIYNLLSRNVSVVDLAARTELRRIPITPTTGEPFSPTVLTGAKIFYSSADPRISRAGKVACASCHINGELDGRSWGFEHLPGPHGPRETPSLLGLYRTMGPRDPATGFGQLHRSGDRDEIQDFEHTFQGVIMGGTGFLGTNANSEMGAPNAGRSSELDALAAYLLSLEPILRSPHRQNDGSLSEAAIRGATFFVGTNRATRVGDAGCAACHVPETGFVDFKFYDVGSRRPGSEEELNTRTPAWAVNTPTLAGVWATSPYSGVAGYAETIMDVLQDQVARAGTSTRHGRPDGLSKRQLADLAEFVLSIDGNMTAAEVRNARDTTPPHIARAEPASLSRIDVWFNETVNRASATNPAAWQLQSTSGVPVPINRLLWDGQNGDRVTLITTLNASSSYRLSVVGQILDAADSASGGVANALDRSDPRNIIDFSITDRLSVTLGASGYENITVPVHDAAVAGPGLATWTHESVWLGPSPNSAPRVLTAFVRWDWKTNFAQFTGVQASSEILDASFWLQGLVRGEAQPIELRRMLKRWNDPPGTGDYNQSPTGAPTWQHYSYPSGTWNSAGAGKLGGTGSVTNDYNTTNDLAARVDGTVPVPAVNGWVQFAAPLVTDAFRFWFDNPSFDNGYSFRLTNNTTQELKFERSEADLREHGPVLSITYSLPMQPVLEAPLLLPDGSLALTLHGQIGRTYALERSADFVSWQLVTPFRATNSAMLLYDSNALSSASQRFYRARTP